MSKKTQPLIESSPEDLCGQWKARKEFPACFTGMDKVKRGETIYVTLNRTDPKTKVSIYYLKNRDGKVVEVLSGKVLPDLLVR